tara:strand:- start:270 stop:575 length:306 start_codon:yes stop_codon:yes gene_type:complete
MPATYAKSQPPGAHVFRADTARKPSPATNGAVPNTATKFALKEMPFLALRLRLARLQSQHRRAAMTNGPGSVKAGSTFDELAKAKLEILRRGSANGKTLKL